MASVHPFRAYRYSAAAGRLDHLVTQPYDKISPAMRQRYLGLSPHNLVRIILGEQFETDSQADNVYTRAAGHLSDWIRDGILTPDPEPSFYAYSQRFTDPDTGETLTRKGFIGLCELEEYENRVVHRHEHTLSGPKKDRLKLLRHTRAHFGQIFLLYADPESVIDRILDEVSAERPAADVTDEYGASHWLWPVSAAPLVEEIRRLMIGKKLIIADGHHRYETALDFRREDRSPAAGRVMATFVNLQSPGLRILATHRVLAGLPGFDGAALLDRLAGLGRLTRFEAPATLKARLAERAPGKIRLGIALDGGTRLGCLEAEREGGRLDVRFLHEEILGRLLGIGEEAVRSQAYLDYVRGIDTALERVRGGAQAAFLLQPAGVEEVTSVALAGGVMPQKSTDFYPKLLSGMTIYKLEP